MLQRTRAPRALAETIGALGLAVLLSGCAEADPVTPVDEPIEPGPAFLTVYNSTAGGAFDVDGYEVRIDGDIVGFVELNDSLTWASTIEGTHLVELGGLASNCAVVHGPPYSVGIQPGSTTQVQFLIMCTPPPELASLRIVFSSRIAGPASSILAMNADGSEAAVLVSDDSKLQSYAGPEVSPNGDRLLFTASSLGDPSQGPDLWVRGTHDGAEGIRLGSGTAYDPRWSPDGSEIVYSTSGGWWGGPLLVIEADGGAAFELTAPDSEDGWPTWAPDGLRIAFTRDESLFGQGDYLNIWIVDRDGTGARPVTTENTAWPVWSTVDDRIAFTRFLPYKEVLRTMSSDGSGVASFVEAPEDSGLRAHDWSADGTLLLFTKITGSGRNDIFLLRVEDGSVVRLTAGFGWNDDPAFW